MLDFCGYVVRGEWGGQAADSRSKKIIERQEQRDGILTTQS